MTNSVTEFRVVRILDEFSVVIDGGYNQEIKENDLFQIYVPGETIFDPNDTNKILGTMDTIKATIIAVEVSPSITICRNAERSSELSIPLSPEWKKILSLFATTTRPMRVEPTQIQTASFPNDPIKIGDNVRKLPKDYK